VVTLLQRQSDLPTQDKTSDSKPTDIGAPITQSQIDHPKSIKIPGQNKYQTLDGFSPDEPCPSGSHHTGSHHGVHHSITCICASDERIKIGMTELVDRGIKVRLVTEITKENINYCKEIMKFSEIRHLEGVNGNFGIIDEREYNMHIIHQELQARTQMINSNVKSSVEAQQFLFNTSWNKAIPAEERITEIEEGLKPTFVETLRRAILEAGTAGRFWFNFTIISIFGNYFVKLLPFVT
jgi:hypothetical protein